MGGAGVRCPTLCDTACHSFPQASQSAQGVGYSSYKGAAPQAARNGRRQHGGLPQQQQQQQHMLMAAMMQQQQQGPYSTYQQVRG